MLAKHLNAPTVEEVESPNRWTPEAGWPAIAGLGALFVAILAAYAVIGYALKGAL